MKKKKLKNYGWCFIIEGFSGSGKTSISKIIHNKIEKKFGKTIILDGDYLRKFFSSINFKIGYKKKYRGKYAAFPISIIINSYLSNNINVIYTNVGLNKSATNVWFKEIKNLFYFIIKTNIKDIIKLNKKKLYSNKYLKNVVGIDIKPDFPKRYDLLINNDFKEPLYKLARKIFMKLKIKY
tara:strand:+ start:38 stop:580 length:543 start_codon:yes stop_codon:yes gene_type:complete